MADRRLPASRPGLAIGNDGVRHAVWYEAKNKPAIHYGQLDPSHPPRHAQLIATSGASHADVAVHGHTVWVVWNQVGAGGYRLMLRHSGDHGAHFDAPRAIASSTGTAGSPQLLQKQGHALVAWNAVNRFRLLRIVP
ncbi:MAG TPA: hypothetical protein VGN24_03205 [Rhodanobacter sp.]|jgi:hypothetical protein|nr:hypothetical protein [Rhodanobacter sp.]